MFLFLVFGGIMAGILGGLMGIGGGIAFIPPKEKLAEKERRAMREKDLEGHIEGEIPELKEEEESKISPDERSDIQKRIDNDNQLSSAIQILRSWNILFKIDSRQAQERA